MAATMWDLQDNRYLRRDGENPMTGPLILSAGAPSLADEAVRKAYVDTLTGALPSDADVAAAILVLTTAGGTIDARIAAVAALYLPLAGGVMTGPLTLSGAPVNALHAATMAYADLMLPLAGGVMLGALTLSGPPGIALHAATKAYVDALPVGLSTYDASVAAAGADYTSVVTACATEAAGARIFIKAGTYNEVADVVMKDGQQLIGENPEDTIIDFGGGAFKITSAAGQTNVTVMRLTVQGSIANYTVDLQGDYARVINNRIIGTVNAFDGVRLTGLYGVLEKNFITGFSRAAAYCARMGQYSLAYGNVFAASTRGIMGSMYGSLVGNNFLTITDAHVILDIASMAVGNLFQSNASITVSGDTILIAGNFIAGATGIEWDAAGHEYTTITGNHFNGSRINCTEATAKDVTITGNTFKDGLGVHTAGLRFTISGNTFFGSAFISLAVGSKDCCIVGNNLAGSTVVGPAKIADLGTVNLAMKNLGVPSLSEKDFRWMENKSGGLLNVGDVVVLDATAAGDEVTTTVTQGDDMVFGILADGNCSDDAYGQFQVEGKTVELKVNGTVAIVVGDLLGTLDAVKIAMKAAAGDMAFAVALEAYAGADSNGRIDALLIKPRKV